MPFGWFKVESTRVNTRMETHVMLSTEHGYFKKMTANVYF